MEKKNEEYIRGLISEMAFGHKTVDRPEDIDSMEDDNFIDNGEDQSTDATAPVDMPKKRQGSAMRNITPKVIKNNAANQLERKRRGLPYNTELLNGIFNGEDYKNKWNKVKKDTLSSNKYGIIQVAVSSPSQKMDKPCYVVTMLNIAKEDCQKLFEEFHAHKHTYRVSVAASRENNTKDGVSFLIPDKFIDLWLEEDLNDIINFIGNLKNADGTSKYFPNEGDEDNLRNYVTHKLIKKEEMTNYIMTAHNNNIELFNSFIEAENDENVQRFIQMYRRFDLINAMAKDLKIPVIFGHILSIRNAQLVLGSGRKTGTGDNPTFILPESLWHKFGRIVKPNAVPFMIYAPIRRFKMKGSAPDFTSISSYNMPDIEGNNTPITDVEDVKKVLFLGKEWKQLSQQEKISAQVLCNYINPSNCTIIREYDITDTDLKDPNKDPFSQEEGLLNNLTGQLNKHAVSAAISNSLSNADLDVDKDADNFEDAFKMNMERKTEFALKNINEYCTANGIDYPKAETDASASLISAMRTIAAKFINHQRTENINRLVDDAVYATCVLDEIALDVIGTLTNRGKVTDDIEFAQYVRAFSALANIIDGSWKHTADGENSGDGNLNEEGDAAETNPFEHHSLKELIRFARETMNDMPMPQQFSNSLNENFMKYCGMDIL